MPESISQQQRSWIMSRVAAKNTTAELLVRKVTRKLKLKFRSHAAELPGKPDIALPTHRIAVLVHGCFWHQHRGCKRARIPKTNRSYWLTKFQRNKRRDRKVVAGLKLLGWKPLIIWECETANAAAIERKLRRYITHRRKAVRNRSAKRD